MALLLALLSALLLNGVPVLAQAPPTRGEGVAPAPFVPERPVPPEQCLPLFEQNRARWAARLPEPFETLRNLYLLGQCHLERGELAEAERRFRQGLAVEAGLAPHWHFKLFETALVRGDVPQGLEWMRALLAADPVPGMVESVRDLLAENILAGQTLGEARAEAGYHYLSTYFSLVEPAEEDHDLIARLLELASVFGDEPLRRRAVLMFWMRPKDEATAKLGREALAALGPGQTRPAGEHYLRRIKTMYRLRLFNLIIEELEAPGLPRWKEEPARGIGRYYFGSLLRKKNYARAAAQIAKRAVKRRFALDRRRSLKLATRIHLRWRRLGTARKLVRSLEKYHPSEEKLPAYYLGLARGYQEKKNLGAMLPLARHILDRFPTAPEAAMAYWLPVWSYYESGDYERARQWAELAMANTGSFSAETRSMFYYWQGRILMAQGKHDAGRETWASLKRLWPTSYYGLMARHMGTSAPVQPRFQSGGGNILRENPRPPALREIWQLPALRSGQFLFVVGENDRAAEIMGRELGKPLGDAVLEELGQIFGHFGRFRLQYRITANYFYSDLKRRPVSDTPVWRYAYPAAYWEHVREQTANQQISPFFVLAVIREESNFHAEAASRSGAKGLMQLMPSTARMLARRHRLPYEEQALIRPGFNITLGTLYLKRVLKRYKWDPILAAASYNAGPNAVKRWTRRFPGLSPDEFVESIPYDETRGYVKRVMSSYFIYTELYGGSRTSG